MKTVGQRIQEELEAHNILNRDKVIPNYAGEVIDAFLARDEEQKQDVELRKLENIILKEAIKEIQKFEGDTTPEEDDDDIPPGCFPCTIEGAKAMFASLGVEDVVVDGAPVSLTNLVQHAYDEELRKNKP